MNEKIKETCIDYPLFDQVTVPFMEFNLLIFTGPEGRKHFDSCVRKRYPDWEGDDSCDGMHCENYIFVENLEEFHILIHETGHYYDYCVDQLSCSEEPEFKACLFQFLTSKIVEWSREVGQ